MIRRELSSGIKGFVVKKQLLKENEETLSVEQNLSETMQIPMVVNTKISSIMSLSSDFTRYEKK